MPDHQNQMAFPSATGSTAAIAGESERTTNTPPVEAEHAHPLDWQEIGRIVFVAVAAGAAWFLGTHLSLVLVLMGVACAIAGGYPIFHEAVENIMERRMTMELSMAIAIL